MPVTQLVVQYNPDGEGVISTVYIPQHVPKNYGSGNAALLTVSNQFGGTQTGGSFRGYDAKGNDGHLIWMNAGSNAFHDVWQMDSKAAAQTAQATIAEALAGEDAVLVLNSAGEAVTGS